MTSMSFITVTPNANYVTGPADRVSLITAIVVEGELAIAVQARMSAATNLCSGVN